MTKFAVRRFIGCVCVGLVTTATLVHSAGAQQSRVASNQPAAVDSHAEEVFSRPVTVDLDHATLKAAVKALALSADVRIQYRNTQLEAETALVTVRATRLPLGQALGLVLAGTHLVPSALGADLIVLTQAADAVTDSITGRVVDSVTKKPLERVLISLDGGVASVKTGTSGTFRFAGLASGTHTVTTRALGYGAQSREVVVRAGEPVRLAFALGRSVNALDQVVVTGSITETQLRAIPNAITVITAKQLEERGITHIDQLFRGDVPGMFAMNLGTAPKTFAGIQQKRGAVKMYSRGATVLDSASPPIKTFVDGVELADADYLNQIDPASIQRIEIIPGPQASAIYGSGALGGVMQIFLKKGTLGQQRPKVTLSLGYGMMENNFSTSRAPQHNDNLSITDAAGPYSYSVNTGYSYDGQWTPGTYTRTYKASGGLTRTSGPYTMTLSTAFSKMRMGAGGGSVQGALGLVEQGIIRNDPDYTIPSFGTVYDIFHSMLGGTLGYRPFNWWSHMLTLGTDQSSNGSITNGARYKNPTDSLSVDYTFNNPQSKSLRYSSTINHEMRWLTTLLTIGGDALSSSSYQSHATGLNIDNLSSPPGYTTEDRSHSASRGYYATVNFNVAHLLYLTAAARAEPSNTLGKTRSIDFTPTWGTSLVHDFGSLTAKGRFVFGRAVRLPQLGQSDSLIYCIDQPAQCASYITPHFGADAQLQIANPNLRPESQSGPDMGLDLYFGNRGSITATYYHQNVKDLLSRVGVRLLVDRLNPTGGMQQYQWQNLGDIENVGWTGGGSLNMGPFGFTGTYSWTKSRVTRLADGYTGDLLVGGSQLGMAEHTGALSVSYSSRGTSLIVSGNGRGQLLQERPFGRQANGMRDQAFYALPNVMGPTPIRALAPNKNISINASRVITPRFTMFLNVQNAGNTYENEGDINQSLYPVLGRITSFGSRIDL